MSRGGNALLPAQSDRFHRVHLRLRRSRYNEAALEASPYPQWVRNLASKERLLHPNPHKRLRLPDLLATLGEGEGEGEPGAEAASDAGALQPPPGEHAAARRPALSLP